MLLEPLYHAVVAPLVLAMAGGVADFILSDDHDWMNLLSGLFLALFIGCMIILGCGEASLSENTTGILAGVGGLSSRAILRVVKRFSVFKVIYFLEQPLDSADKKEKGAKRKR